MQTEKHDRVQEMTDAAITQLGEALAAGKSETLMRYLATMSKFHRYSLNNQLLTAWQKPDATHVAGFNAWKKLHRFVRKGEKGIMILAPVMRKVRTTEERQSDGTVESKEVRGLVNVKVVHVFDISQTDGEPLPEFAEVRGDCTAFTAKLDELIVSKGIELQYAESLHGALGMSSGKRITVLSSLEPTKAFAVKVHELAHELLHQGPRLKETSKKVRETEAEAVAYVVCNALGLDCSTASSDYIQLYRGDTDTLRESLHFIRTAASEIIAALTSSDLTSDEVGSTALPE